MLHALALVKIENGSAEHFLEPFLQVTFVDGHLAAQLLDGKGFADMLQEHFPGPDDLFPVCLIGQEFTLEPFHFLFTHHAFKTVQQEHLALGIDEDILHAVRIAMVEQSLQHQAGPSAKRKYLGKRGGMTKVQDFLAKGAFRSAGFAELGEMDREEPEAKHIHRIHTLAAARRLVDLTGIALHAVPAAVHIPGYAKS